MRFPALRPVKALAMSLLALSAGVAGLAVAVLAVLAVLAVAAAPPAGAHDDVGAITVVGASPVGPRSVAYEVEVTFTNDGHAATEATVTVVGEGSGGVVGPERMVASGQAGHYRATVTFPAAGPWEVRFSSLTPLATAQRAEQVSASASTSTTAGSATSVASAPVASTAPTPTTSAAASTTAPVARPTTEGGDDGGVPVGLVVVAAVVVVALAGGGAWAVARRRAPRP